jgi:hypothetical protein
MLSLYVLDISPFSLLPVHSSLSSQFFTSLFSFLTLQVEGEIDKLSMEEAGYRNCVSVPDGAPPQVSNKLPDKDHVRTIS